MVRQAGAPSEDNERHSAGIRAAGPHYPTRQLGSCHSHVFPGLRALLTHPWVFVLWFGGVEGGVVDHCGSDRFVAVSGRGGFMRGAAALSWSTRSGRPALPAVVAREPPQGSPRQSADLTRTPGPRCSRCSAWWCQTRPGSAGRWPPRASMARAISASGERNPNAIRASSLILVLTDSISPWDRP